MREGWIGSLREKFRIPRRMIEFSLIMGPPILIARAYAGFVCSEIKSDKKKPWKQGEFHFEFSVSKKEIHFLVSSVELVYAPTKTRR